MTNHKCSLLVLAAALAIAGHAAAEGIAAASYAEPVDRYGHFALGRPHEYARLAATTAAGRTLTLRLPENEVFEDIAPRIVRLAPGGPDEVLGVVSERNSGSRLALFGVVGTGLVMTAQSMPIGRPNRWLNPVGAADLDDDGRAEIAAVITPHIGGVLKVYRRSGNQLVEIAALDGFSNHVYGTPELALSLPVTLGSKVRLLVPDAQRRFLRLIALQDGRLAELGRCALPSPVIGPMRLASRTDVSVGLLSGRSTVTPGDCGK